MTGPGYLCSGTEEVVWPNPHQSNIMLIDTHIVISHPLFIHQSQGLMVDITGCPQAIRKRECCIGCEAILSRLTYSEEELGFQKKSMALVLVNLFHIRNFRKEIKLTENLTPPPQII